MKGIPLAVIELAIKKVKEMQKQNDDKNNQSVSKKWFVQYLAQIWKCRDTSFDNLFAGRGYDKIKTGYTCLFHRKDCNVEFVGTVMYSKTKCAYVVISDCKNKTYITFLNDVYPISTPVFWMEYYKDLLSEVENEQ